MSWIWKNKEWIFSGVGLAIVASLIGLIWGALQKDRIWMLVIVGSIFVAGLFWLMRCFIMNKTKSHDQQLLKDVGVIRREFAQWCIQIRSVLKFLESRAEQIDFRMFENILNQLRMHHDKDDTIYRIPADIGDLIRKSSPDFTELSSSLGNLKQYVKNETNPINKRGCLIKYIQFIEQSEETLLDIKNPAYYDGGSMRGEILRKATEVVSKVQNEASVLASQCR